MGLTGMFGVGVRAKRACRRGAVDSQHGSRVEGSSHPCTKGTTSSKGLCFCLITTHLLISNGICCKYAFCAIHIFDNSRYNICCKYAFCAINIFLLFRLKINHEASTKR
jgi:hypothetical protein